MQDSAGQSKEADCPSQRQREPPMDLNQMSDMMSYTFIADSDWQASPGKRRGQLGSTSGREGGEWRSLESYPEGRVSRTLCWVRLGWEVKRNVRVASQDLATADGWWMVVPRLKMTTSGKEGGLVRE